MTKFYLFLFFFLELFYKLNIGLDIKMVSPKFWRPQSSETETRPRQAAIRDQDQGSETYKKWSRPRPGLETTITSSQLSWLYKLTLIYKF